MAGSEYLFIDIETTGLSSHDRIVSIGLVSIPKPNFGMTELLTKSDYLIFDPRRDSAPGALAIHGFDEWLLRHQPLFADHADYLIDRLNNADLVFAHNANFDAGFLSREFKKCGIEFNPDRVSCTLRGYKSQHAGPANLDFICQRFGLDARGKRHHALVDAYRCMLVYLWLIGFKFPELALPEDVLNFQPQNFVVPPPNPGTPLPRRSPKRAKQATKRHTAPQTAEVEANIPPPDQPNIDHQEGLALFEDALKAHYSAPLKPPQPPPPQKFAARFFAYLRKLLNIQ